MEFRYVRNITYFRGNYVFFEHLNLKESSGYDLEIFLK